MKKRILLVLALSVYVFFVQAQEQPYFAINAGDIKNISIMDDMDVVLISGNNPDKQVSMSRDAMERLEMHLEAQTLEIFAKKPLPVNGKHPIYIHVNELAKLTVSGTVNLKTWGVINAEHLDLFVKGNARVQVRATGKINAYPLDDSDIRVEYINPVQRKDVE